MKTYEKLKNIIKNNNITIYDFAQICGIERTLLSKMLNGKRSITPQSFSQITKSLSMSAERREELASAYIAENFGAEKFKDYINFLEKFAEITKVDLTPKKTVTELKTDNDLVVFYSPHECYNITEAVIIHEINKPDGGRIYSNINTNSFFEICKSTFGTKRIDFRLLTKVKGGSVNFKNSFLNYAFYALQGYPVRYYKAENGNTDNSTVLYPNYIITDDICIFVDASMSHGYMQHNKVIADLSAERFLAVFNAADLYIEFYTDIMELKAFHENRLIHDNLKQIIFEDAFCSVFSLSKEHWEHLARPELPDREYLIDSTYEYYQMFRNGSEIRLVISTLRALRQFTNSGIVTQMPIEIINPLSVEDRLAVLMDYRQYIEDYRIDYHIIKKDAIMPQLFACELCIKDLSKSDHNMYFALQSLNGALSVHGDTNIFINDNETIEGFNEFLDYLSISEYCYTQEKSLKIFDEEIDRCRHMLEKNQAGEDF